MKLAVFGGSSKTGALLLEQALKAGHEVTALARTPSKVTLQHQKLTVVPGDAQNPAAVARVIDGAEAVISLMGPTSNAAQMTISAATQNILTAMQTVNLRRLVLVTGAGVGDPHDKPGLIDRIFKLVLGVVSKNVIADMLNVARMVRASGVEWTIVRAPMLTDAPAQGATRVGYLGSVGVRLSRADLAAFTLQQVEDRSYVRQAPVISN